MLPKVKFRPLLSVTDLASPFDSGWRFGVAVSGAAVLSILILGHLAILLALIGLL